MVFVDKLNKMTTLLNKREGGTEAMDDLYHYFLTDSTAIVTSTYDYYTRIFELDLAANDIFSLAKFLISTLFIHITPFNIIIYKKIEKINKILSKKAS